MGFMNELVDSVKNEVADETGYRWMRDFLSDHGVAPEPLLLKLVAAARRGDGHSSESDLRKHARKRQRRLSIASKIAMPTGPVRELLELYGDTATVIELSDLHGLQRSDEEIAAVMLVLWDVTPELAAAQETMSGAGTSLNDLLTARVRGLTSEAMPNSKSPVQIVKALWRLRGLVADAAEMGPKFLGAGDHVADLSERAMPLLQSVGAPD